MIRKTLIISAAANAVLGVGLAHVYSELRDARSMIAGGAAQTLQSVVLSQQPTRLGMLPVQDSAFTEEEIRRDFDLVIATGGGSEVALRVLAASVREVLGRNSPYSYWEPPARREFERQVSTFQKYDAARELVSKIAGPEAVNAKALEFLYKPLNDRLPFLSSAKQIAVQRIRIDAQRELLAGSGAPSRLGLGANVNTALADDLKNILSEDEYFEYQVRESAASQILAASSFNFTEQEFRKVFAIVEKEAVSRPFVGSMFGMTNQAALPNAVQAKVGAVLGESRFREFRRVQDPVYKFLRSIADANGIPGDSVVRAYDVLDRASQEALQIRMNGPLFTSAQRDQVKVIIDERDNELKRLLGEKGFEDFQRHPGSADARLGMSLVVPTRSPIGANR